MRTLSLIAIFTLLIGAAYFQFSSHDEHTHRIEIEPIAFGKGGECEACSMYVSEQPGPRAQLIYKAGERRFFCSLGDLLSFLTLPSPHGLPVQIWVEAMPADTPPNTHSSDPQPWVKAESARYVTGIDRGAVMGMPALSFASKTHAEQFTGQHGGDVNDWGALKRVHNLYMQGKHR